MHVKSPHPLVDHRPRPRDLGSREAGRSDGSDRMGSLVSKAIREGAVFPNAVPILTKFNFIRNLKDRRMILSL